MRVSSSLWASHTASSLPMMVICSCSGSSGDGKMIRAPVRSRTRRILAPPLPIRNLWYSGLAWSSTEKLLTCWWDKRQMSHMDWMTGNITAFPVFFVFLFILLLTFSSASCSSCLLALSTSSAGPRMVTLSNPEPSAGKWIWTPPHSSITERTRLPLDPIRELCSLAGMETSASFRLAWDNWKIKWECEREEKLRVQGIISQTHSLALCFSHQLFLNGGDPISCGFTAALLACDHDHLRVAVFRWEINLGVGLLTYLYRFTQQHNLSR